MNPMIFVTATLAVWRITHLLQSEDGPFNLIFLIRQKAGTSVFGNLLDCFYCLSLWVAFPFAIWLGGEWKEKLLLWIAYSGGAIFMYKLTEK